MSIESISISRFRNLQPAELRFSERLNLFVGENAAGKTSVLEALFVLARGRSFRTAHLDKLIQHGHDEFQLVIQLMSEDGRRIPIGMSRSRGHLHCRIAGRPAKRLSELAMLLPIQWVGGNLHSLVEDGPAQRRQFLDWGLFHVKPDYMPLWKTFHKLLKQRNAALRSGANSREVRAWNPKLAETGEELHRFRKNYLDHLLIAFRTVGSQLFSPTNDVVISYLQGWRAETTYLDVLNESTGKDLETGYTRAGPQRAELNFSINGRPVIEELSHGQQKVFITMLQLAQAIHLYQETGKTSLFLLDDLGSELDIANQQRILNHLFTIGAQIFVTAIEQPGLSGLNAEHLRLFHVKRGLLSEMVYSTG
jgi:DNA replication and repair protein RecF